MEEGFMPLLERPFASDMDTPLHKAALTGNAAEVERLLAAAPAAVRQPGRMGVLPLHEVIMGQLFPAEPQQRTAIVRRLVAAAPETVVQSAEMHSRTPIELVAWVGNADLAAVLIEEAPQHCCGRSLVQPIGSAVIMGHYGVARCYIAASAAGPSPAAAGQLLSVLEGGLEHARLIHKDRAPLLGLYADVVAAVPLSEQQWRRVPSPCPGLLRALPALLARSPEAEVRRLVARLMPADRVRLQAIVLCLARAGSHRLPTPLFQRLLALCATAE